MKNTIITLLFSALILGVFTGCSNKLNPRKFDPTVITWLTLEEAEQLNKKKPRKIMIDAYTDWCGWCKKMDKVTFIDPDVIREVNENWYAVKLDGEHKETINFKGKEYKFIPKGRGYNEIVRELVANRQTGRTSYPTMTFLDENLNLIQAVPGYQKPETLQMVLSYFGNDEHHETPWTDYQQIWKAKQQQDAARKSE